MTFVPMIISLFSFDFELSPVITVIAFLSALIAADYIFFSPSKSTHLITCRLIFCTASVSFFRNVRHSSEKRPKRTQQQMMEKEKRNVTNTNEKRMLKFMHMKMFAARALISLITMSWPFPFVSSRVLLFSFVCAFFGVPVSCVCTANTMMKTSIIILVIVIAG